MRSLPSARNSQPYRNRRACAGNTNCIPICPIQAKYDPTITLNEATNNGARLIHHAVASEILVENDRVSGINLYHLRRRVWTEDREWLPSRPTVYVIAANGIETPRLLLMSKNNGQTPNGVANSSDMVGRNLMDHPQYLTWGLLPKRTGVPISRSAGDLGHRRTVRRSVSRTACRLPGQLRAMRAGVPWSVAVLDSAAIRM